MLESASAFPKKASIRRGAWAGTDAGDSRLADSCSIGRPDRQL